MDSNPSISPDTSPSDSPTLEPAPPSSPPSRVPSKVTLWKWIFPLIIIILLLGILFFVKENRYLDPLFLFHKKSNAQTESARLWVHYGTLQHHIGELPEAIAAYQQASSFDPDLYEAWWNLSQVYDSLHLPQEQLNALQQAVRSRPESPEAWASLTKIYLQLNQDHDAMMSRQQEEIAKNEALKEEDHEKICLENPSHIESWIQWGMSRAIYRFVQPNSYDPKTVEIFQKASEQEPSNPWIWAHLGLSCIKKRNEIPGSPFLTEVEVPTLIAFQKSAELLPHDPTLFFLLGRAALWKGEWNTAINAFQLSTQSNRTSWLAWYYLGETYLASNRTDEAIAAYTKAQSLSPDSLEIQYGVAQAYLQKGNIEEAQAILEKERNSQQKIIPFTRRTRVQIPLHQALLTQSLRNQKQDQATKPPQPNRAPSMSRLEIISPESIPILETKELSSDEKPIQHRQPQLPLLNENGPLKPTRNGQKDEKPESPAENLHLIAPTLSSITDSHPIPPSQIPSSDPNQLKQQLRDLSLDEKTLRTIILSNEKTNLQEIALPAAIQLSQRYPTANSWITLGYIYGLQNQTAQEIESYQKALLKDPKNRTALFNIGLAQLQQHRYSKAQISFEKIVQYNTEDSEGWYHLGLSFERQERWNEASAAYQKATTIKPNYGDAWLNLGGIYASIKRPDLEIETYKKCLELNPDYQPAWNNLAIILKSIGKMSDYEATKKRIEATTR